MPVSQQAVNTLRHEVEAMLRDGIGTDAGTVQFETTAESLGYLVHVLRTTTGMDEDEIADEVELAARAIEIDQQELREARDVLKALQYSPVLITRLTAVARRA